MKKEWIFVLFIGALAVLSYLSRSGGRKEPAAPAAPPVQETVGVELPRDVEETLKAAPEADAPVLGPPGLDYKAGGDDSCKEITPRRVIADYGKRWGKLKNTMDAFEPEEQKKVKELLTSYLSCNSILYGDAAFCYNAPSDEIRINCQNRSEDVLFYAFTLGGGNVNKDVCMSQENMFGAKPAEFCALAASGMENICSSLRRSFPQMDLKACRSKYPRALKDCAGIKDKEDEEDCRTALAIYNALKRRVPGECGDAYRKSCETYVYQEKAYCTSIASELSSSYCGYLTAISDRALARKEADKDELERRAQEKAQIAESKRIGEEINANVRRRLGKTGNEDTEGD